MTKTKNEPSAQGSQKNRAKILKSKKFSQLLTGLNIALLVFFVLMSSLTVAQAASLLERLKGRILLQIEQHGEAWYVNPADGKRYFLGRPSDALEVMRQLGLGISDSDLSQIAKGDIATAGWPTYHNKKYGFEIKYPKRYIISENTSGWPNAVALFREEWGQAYDAQIEVWDSADGYKNKYGTAPSSMWKFNDLNKFITVNYYEYPDKPGYIEEWSRVINTFKFVD